MTTEPQPSTSTGRKRSSVTLPTRAYLCPTCLDKHGFTLDLRPGHANGLTTVPDGSMRRSVCDECGSPGSVWEVQGG